LKIIFIGTGSGKTSLNRFHSSLLINALDYNLLVDAGDSVSRAILTLNIPFNSINGILISHLHPDHFSGIGSLIVQMKMNKRKESLSIFIHQTLVKTLENFLSESYIFKERIEFPVHYKAFEFNTEIRIAQELGFLTRGNTHLYKYKKYGSSISPACGSFLFSSGNKKIIYTGDIGSNEDLYLFKDTAVDIYITESSHIDFSDILNMSELLKPGKIVITHLSDEDIPGLKENIGKSKKDSIILAEDGLILSV
jgi:ribonuclease Z